MAQHQAAFLDGANKPLQVRSTDTKKPGPGEILVKTAAVAINPVDWKIQSSGAFIKEWPIVLGEDVAGEVVEVGDGVTGFAKGQRVILHSQFLQSKTRIELAGFQEFVVSAAATAAPLPDAVSYEAGAVLPLAVSTAAAGLFQPDFLALDKPSTAPSKSNSGKSLLVWGGSSSVGTAAVQLGVAAGYDVVATASQKNFDLVKSLGARAVLDYHSPTVVADLVAELKKSEFVGVFDAISLSDTQLAAAKVAQELGGGTIATTLPGVADVPEKVTIKGVLAITIFNEFAEVGKAVWQDFLPQALKSGQFKPSPPYKVVGKDLGALQAGLDELKAGVSGTKLVVTL